ncbi:MAG: class II aldolase [Thiotrichales bacterium]|nr:class II aldolase [Thiotrichales bacterium]
MSASPKSTATISPEEWAVRTDLAACYRLASHFRMTDLIHTHISARVPGTRNEFLINAYGLWFHEVTASNLVKIDIDGNKLDSSEHPVNPAGFIIHAAIHEARDDAHCVMHTHTRAGVAVSTLECGLLPISQFALRFHGKVGYHDYEGATLVPGERERLQQSMAEHDVLILRNHGLITLGDSVAEAFDRMYSLNNACQVQVDALQTGKPLVEPSTAVCELTAGQYAGDGEEDMSRRRDFIWQALLRLVENNEPSYRS